MERAGLRLLERVFNVWQNQGSSRGIPVSLVIDRQRTPEYFAVCDVNQKEQLHALLKQAERLGCVSLEWSEQVGLHPLRKLNLVAGDRLGEFLGLKPALSQALAMETELTRAMSGKHRWIGNLVDGCLERWRKNQTACGIRVEEVKEAKELVLALEAVAANRHIGMDMHSFSARYVGDPQAIERMQGRLAAIFRYQYQMDDLTSTEVFEVLGLSKFPWPVYLRGPVRVESGDSCLDGDSGPAGYVALPPQQITRLVFKREPTYLLTIENMAAFKRYTQEVRDNGIIIWTDGFPGPKLREVLRKFDLALPEDFPFYHWGDLDLGGVKIFRMLETTVNRHELQPHLMDAELLRKHGQPPLAQLDSQTLERLRQAGGRAAGLAETLLAYKAARVLLQEQVTPSSPEPEQVLAEPQVEASPTIEAAGMERRVPAEAGGVFAAAARLVRGR